MRLHTSTYLLTGKKRLYIILSVIFLTCFTNNGFSQKFEKKGNLVKYRGNTFVLSVPAGDRTTTVPEKMNGNRIYRVFEVEAPPIPYTEAGSVEDYLFRELIPELNKLPDGRYTLPLTNIVVDEIGKIVYYESLGIQPQKATTKVPALLKQAIIKKVDLLINKVAPLRPGQLSKHRSVVVLTDISLNGYSIEVHNHKTTIKKQ